MSARSLRFLVVGGAGFAVQMAALALLTSRLRLHWVWATAFAVELAILHNFCWHLRWTWRDRSGAGWPARLAKFHAATAVTSIGGNLALMTLLVALCHVPPVPANALAVGILGVVNYTMADRWVFRHAPAAVAVALLAVALPNAATAGPSSELVEAWNRVVAQAEATAEQPDRPCATVSAMEAEGRTIRIEGGTVSRWCGAVLIRGITLDRLLYRLQHPGTPPPQEDIASARVLARAPDALRVSMRIVRRALVTVTYDTEHEMAFRRLSPTTAAARSVATRIEEVGGGDRGFLWKLNSYWRYEARSEGVFVRVETLTLSRDVPLLLRPIAGPIVERVARESMLRTLAALRDYMQA
jgi:putative flippase GtrA